MKKIKEVIIDNKKIFLKKNGDSYRVIYPIKIDGKINWKNLISGGNWFNLIKIGLLVLVILGCVNEYSMAVKTANDCLNSSHFSWGMIAQ